METNNYTKIRRVDGQNITLEVYSDGMFTSAILPLSRLLSSLEKIDIKTLENLSPKRYDGMLDRQAYNVTIPHNLYEIYQELITLENQGIDITDTIEQIKKLIKGDGN